MKKKVLYIFRNDTFLKDILKKYQYEKAPTEFLWGYNEIDIEKFEVSYINAPRNAPKKGLRKFLAIFEYPLRVLAKMGMPLEIYPMFKKEIKEADIIYCVNDQISLGILAWKKLGFLKDKKVVCMIMALQERIKYFRKNRPLIWFFSSLLKKADLILTLSNFVHTDFVKDYSLDKNKVKTCYFGIDTNFWKKTERVSEKNFILSIGNDMNRDFACLVEALPENIPLKIITNRKIDKKGKNIEVLSGLSNEKLREVYNKAKFVVIPNKKLKNESSGLSCALQTLACEKPLLIAYAPTIEEVLKSGVECETYEAENILSLKEKIQKLFIDKECREKLQKQGNKKVKEKYSMQKVGQSLSDLFDKLT